MVRQGWEGGPRKTSPAGKAHFGGPQAHSWGPEEVNTLRLRTGRSAVSWVGTLSCWVGGLSGENRKFAVGPCVPVVLKDSRQCMGF